MCALYHCVIGITLEYLTSYISVQLLASQRPLTDVFRLASRETSLVLVTPKVTISRSKNQIFMPLFYVHIGQKPIFPVFHGQIWLKLHPTLLNRTSHFRHFSTECSPNHRENSTGWKIQLYPTEKTHQKRSQGYHYSHLRWRHQRPTQASSITKSYMILIKPKSTPYTLYNILYLIYTKGYKISPFQTYKAVCLVPYVYRVSPDEPTVRALRWGIELLCQQGDKCLRRIIQCADKGIQSVLERSDGYKVLPFQTYKAVCLVP